MTARLNTIISTVNNLDILMIIKISQDNYRKLAARP